MRRQWLIAGVISTVALVGACWLICRQCGPSLRRVKHVTFEYSLYAVRFGDLGLRDVGLTAADAARRDVDVANWCDEQVLVTTYAANQADARAVGKRILKALKHLDPTANFMGPHEGRFAGEYWRVEIGDNVVDLDTRESRVLLHRSPRAMLGDHELRPDDPPYDDPLPVVSPR